MDGSWVGSGRVQEAGILAGRVRVVSRFSWVELGLKIWTGVQLCIAFFCPTLAGPKLAHSCTPDAGCVMYRPITHFVVTRSKGQQLGPRCEQGSGLRVERNLSFCVNVVLSRAHMHRACIVSASVCVSVCLHKISKTTDQKLM